jgi:M6 family metalloprotease-like protein
MRPLRTLIVLTSLVSLLVGPQFGTAQTHSDFTQPYGPVQHKTGTQPLLVILLGTADASHAWTRNQQQIHDLIFGARDSVAAYYLENSYGQFTFTEAYTTPWLIAQDDPSTTGRNESSADFLYAGGYDIEREKSAYVIQQVELQTNFRFSDWDTNQDGRIREDELSILWIYPEAAGGRERGIYPQPVNVPSLSQGVQVSTLARVADDDPHLLALIAHELGHSTLGLDDLYEDSTIGYLGNAGYSLMAQHQGTCPGTPGTTCLTAPHLDPWSKIKLGWLTPTVITSDGWYVLDAVETSPTAAILYNPNHSSREYFIVENRWPGSSYEQGLPDQGLAIWHIDENYAGQDGWGRQTIHLERAQGMAPADAWASLWDGADPLGSYNFTPGSSPANSRWQDGSSSSIGVDCVGAAGSSINVFFDIPPAREALQFVSAPAAVNSSDGQLLNLFALAGSGYVAQTSYTRDQSVGWRDWAWLPGSVEFVGAPAVVNSPDGSLVDVFVTGKDGAIYEITYVRGGGGWQSWTPLPGGLYFVSAPAAINSPDGALLDVFAVASDGNLYEIVYARGGGGWQSWTALPGGVALASAPAAVNGPDGSVLDVFVLGQDGNLYEIVYTRGGAGWGAWTPLPGGIRFASAPAVINSPDGGLLDVFVQGNDGRLYELVYARGGGGWGGWQVVPGLQLASAPAAANSPDGSLLDVFALGQDGNLYQIVYARSAGGWGQWMPVTQPVQCGS